MKMRIVMFVLCAMGFAAAALMPVFLEGCAAVPDLPESAAKDITLDTACAVLAYHGCLDEEIVQAVLPGIDKSNCPSMLTEGKLTIVVPAVLKAKQPTCQNTFKSLESLLNNYSVSMNIYTDVFDTSPRQAALLRHECPGVSSQDGPNIPHRDSGILRLGIAGSPERDAAPGDCACIPGCKRSIHPGRASIV
jgi:hypothetical protein